MGKKSFGYNGCVLWNKLPGHIRNLIHWYPNFKVAVKKFLLSKIDSKFYFTSSIDLYGFKVFTSILNYCFILNTYLLSVKLVVSHYNLHPVQKDHNGQSLSLFCVILGIKVQPAVRTVKSFGICVLDFQT